MKTSKFRLHLLWIVILAVVLVLFPFDWLSTVWPAYGHIFDLVFVSEREHAIGHTTLFLLAGLLLLSSLPSLRGRPFLYALLMAVGAAGEEFFQAVARWHLPSIYSGRDIGFDVLGFTLAYLLGWLWWRLKNVRAAR